MASRHLQSQQQHHRSSPQHEHNHNASSTYDHTQGSSQGNPGAHQRSSSGATSRHWQADNSTDLDSFYEAAARLAHGGAPSASFLLQCLQQELSLKAGCGGAPPAVGPSRLPAWPADAPPLAGAAGSAEAMLQALGADSDFPGNLSGHGTLGLLGPRSGSAQLAGQRLGVGRFQELGLLDQQQGHKAPAVRGHRDATAQDFGVPAGSVRGASLKGLHSAAGLSPEVLRAFLSGSAELNPLQASALASILDGPTSATSSLLAQWLQDIEGGRRPRHGSADQREFAKQQSCLLGTHQGASQMPPTAVAGQGIHGGIIKLARTQLFPGSGATGDSLAGAKGATGGGDAALARALLSAQAKSCPSRSRVSFNPSEGPEGEASAGRGSHWSQGLDAALGDAVQTNGKGGGVLSPPESRSTCSNRGQEGTFSPLREMSHASLDASFDTSMGGSAGGRREPRTDDDRRKRKLALNREAARRMRLRQSMRLEQLEKMVEDLQATNQATQTRLENADKKVADLTRKNDGLEDRMVEVVEAIVAQEQPQESLKEKLAALTQCLSAKALARMPEGLEGLQKGEVVEECEEGRAGQESSEGHLKRKAGLDGFDEEGRHPADCYSRGDLPDEAVEQCLENSPPPKHVRSDSSFSDA